MTAYASKTKHRKNYLRKEKLYPPFEFSMRNHEPLSNFNLLNNFLKNKFIEIDESTCRPLLFDEEYYSMKLDEIYHTQN